MTQVAEIVVLGNFFLGEGGGWGKGFIWVTFGGGGGGGLHPLFLPCQPRFKPLRSRTNYKICQDRFSLTFFSYKLVENQPCTGIVVCCSPAVLSTSQVIFLCMLTVRISKSPGNLKLQLSRELVILPHGTECCLCMDFMNITKQHTATATRQN